MLVFMSRLLALDKKLDKTFWNKFEKFLGSKIPPIIKTILSEYGFDNELVLQTLNEDAIKIIEEKVRAGVRENPNLLNGTAYDQTTQNFHFLLGHRLLILDFANKAREFVQSKKKTSEETRKRNCHRT